MARLLWEHEGQVIKDYPFPKGSVTIGRRKENSIVFTNPEVSSLHARIDKVGPDYILTDLQSTNGTFVNGLRVLSQCLSHGDRISIGKNVLLFIGTEKAKADAERAKIPLDQTVIIGGLKRRKEAPAPRAKIEPHYIELPPSRNYLRVFVFGFLVVGALVVLGVFAVKYTTFFLKGSVPKANQGERTEGTAVAPSAEGGETSQQGDVPMPATSESPELPAVNEETSEGRDTESAPFSIEAIVWSSDAKKSFVLINGVEFRVGDSVKGKTIARIERDHVVLQSLEGESIIRLKLK
jgi:hypothetical protein